MTVIEPRIAERAWACPWGCYTVVPVGDPIWPIISGSTESSACTQCAWRHENGYPMIREIEEDA